MKTPLMAALLVVAGTFAGCAGKMPVEQPVEIAPEHLLSGAAILGRPVDPGELPRDPVMTITAEMRDFLTTIAPDVSPQRRLAALIEAFETQKFHVEYDQDSTLTAGGTFSERRGNCLAFTLMMVAMARELGVEASFNEVDVPPVWGHEDPQTFVVYRHINMVSEHPRGRRVVDFNLAAYDPVYEQRKLPDVVVLAQYYSNRGVELMNAGDGKRAFLYLRKALALQPGNSNLWSNLGALYSRFGHKEEAEQSYQRALLFKPENLVALSNLERLYRRQGAFEVADYYAGRVRYHRERNPYYLYYLARSAYEEGEYRRAQKQLRRALWKYDSDHRFHFLLGLTRYRLGEFEDSQDSFRAAFALAERAETRSAYMNKLKYLIRNGEQN
ncbi:tetratricopeptide repeat protein [Microbulbifer sp. 2201CG32-9]|uniref:tetratricopeptide repeat protein n=1 Tax=Microbulbifer sp. 2201CG32-9 TaxID=3232309 RepID=UPI00345BB4A4